MKKRKCEQLNRSCDEIVLNVGGTFFSTCRVTLSNAPNSMLFARFAKSSFHPSSFFIDRDPTLFRHVLNWLRSRQLDHAVNSINLLRDLQVEAAYYCIAELEKAISVRISLLQSRRVHAFNDRFIVERDSKTAFQVFKQIKMRIGQPIRMKSFQAFKEGGIIVLIGL